MHYFKRGGASFLAFVSNKKEKYFFGIVGGEAGWKK